MRLERTLHKVTTPKVIDGIEANAWVNGNLQPSKILFKDGKITSVKNIPYEVDSNYIVLPGIVDNHIHARESATDTDVNDQGSLAKENAYTASLAALQGGTTSVVAMPNLQFAIDTDENYDTQGNVLNSERDFRPAPLIPIEHYVPIFPRRSNKLEGLPHKMLWDTFAPTEEFRYKSDKEVIQRLKFFGEDDWVTAHCETIADILNEGLHHEKRQPQAAIHATKMFLKAAGEYGFHAHVAHISTPEEIMLVEEAKYAGISASCEITPQSLFLDYDTFEQKSKYPLSHGQQNPPLRSKKMREEMLELVADGLVDWFATDHAPHTLSQKEGGMSGMPQLSTSGLIYQHLVANGSLPLDLVVKMQSENPAQFVERFFGRKVGKIAEGYSADLIIVDTNKPGCITDEEVLSNCRWSPYSNIGFSRSIPGVVSRGTLYTQEALQNLRWKKPE